jgi:hypothetical protein
MSSEFDYAGWVRRARKFVRARTGRPGFEVAAAEAESGLARGDADRLAGELGVPLPPALRAFFERGAAALNCGYTFEYDPDDATETAAFLALFPGQTSIYGGPRIGPAADLPEMADGCAAWGAEPETEAGLAGGPPRVGTRRLLPFIAVENGDYVALDLRVPDAGDDPPVVSVSHEGEGARLADSFTGFLAAWERLAYLGPELWLLESFLGPDGLAPETAAAQRWRALLGA